MKSINASFIILNKDKINGDEVLEKLESIARTCYKSENLITKESKYEFIRGIIKRGHEAMLEHYSLSIKFICDRGISHELVRHRVASFAQESTRYCNSSGDKFGNQISVIDISTGFHYDLSNPKDLKKYEVWVEAMSNAEKSYFKMIEDGAKPEEARSVLPNSLKTEIVVTMNLREWRHFFNLRAVGTTGKPHPQIKEVASELLKEIKTKLPIFFDDIEINEEK